MVKTFGKKAKEIQAMLAVTVPSPTDCQTAADLIEALQAWSAINCPIARPAKATKPK